MHTIILNRQKHASLLADHRLDPVTKLLLKAGDEVVVCASCKTVYLKDVWINTKNRECCGQALTADNIPNSEFATIKRNERAKQNGTPVVVKKHYPGLAIFFLLTTIAGAIYAYNLRQEINKESSGRFYLEQQLEQLKTSNQSTQALVNDINAQRDMLTRKYTNLANLVKNTTLYGGLWYEVRKEHDFAYGNYSERVNFTVSRSILFKSVKVDAGGSGYLRVKIYNDRDVFIGEAYNGYITEGVETLTFNQVLNPGSYYLTHDGNTNLLFNSNFRGYPVRKNDLLTITGTAFNDNTYYMYYYDWQYSIQPE